MHYILHSDSIQVGRSWGIYTHAQHEFSVTSRAQSRASNSGPIFVIHVSHSITSFRLCATKQVAGASSCHMGCSVPTCCFGEV